MTKLVIMEILVPSEIPETAHVYGLEAEDEWKTLRPQCQEIGRAEAIETEKDLTKNDEVRAGNVIIAQDRKKYELIRVNLD